MKSEGKTHKHRYCFSHFQIDCLFSVRKRYTILFCQVPMIPCWQRWFHIKVIPTLQQNFLKISVLSSERLLSPKLYFLNKRKFWQGVMYISRLVLNYYFAFLERERVYECIRNTNSWLTLNHISTFIPKFFNFKKFKVRNTGY